MTDLLPARAAVPVEYTWNTASIFPSHTAWEEEFQSVGEALSGLEAYRGRLGVGAAILSDWLETAYALFGRVARLQVYAALSYAVDVANQETAARHTRAVGLVARTRAAAAFAEPEILQIGADTLQSWMRELPTLAIYAHYFDQLERRRPHVRSAEVEALLNEVHEPLQAARTIHSVLSDAELQFQPPPDAPPLPQEIGQGTIGALLSNPDRAVRKTAWETYADVYLTYKNTFANCLEAGIKRNVFCARARRYPSALEAALAPKQIPVEVFHNLIATYRKNLPTWRRYWNLRRRALGLETLHVYDIKAPLTSEMPVVPFSQAVEWVAEGMKPLGEEYVARLRKGVLEQRWVDIYPNRGKRMGAFSSGVPGTYPFILMNYNDDIAGLSTLAHELGHSLHSYYAWETQPIVYAAYSSFEAEVASNFNQALVRAYLLETNPDPHFQIALIEEAMANFHRYFFLMPTLARFELEIHERVERGEALTSDRLIALLAELFREGYGEEVEMDEARVGITWAQFPTHLYNNFYVYEYATGIAGAQALAGRVLAGEPGAAERYLAFLRRGASRYPLDSLREAGVDLTTPEPVEQAFASLAGLVERLDEQLAER